MNGIVKPPIGIYLKKGHPLVRGLIGCWLLNEGGGGFFFDLSLKGYSGLEEQDSIWTGGEYGICRYFSGDDGINITDFVKSAHITLIAKIRCTDIAGDYRQICSSDAGAGQPTKRSWQWRINQTTGYQSFIVFCGGSTNTATGTTNLLNEDIIVAATHDGITTRIYEDGIEAGSDNTNSGDIEDLSTLGCSIGKVHPELDSYYFVGNIEFVYIYNRALMINEIRSINRYPFQMFDYYYFTPLISAASGGAGLLEIYVYDTE